jgi:hypothetical protein
VDTFSWLSAGDDVVRWGVVFVVRGRLFGASVGLLFSSEVVPFCSFDASEEKLGVSFSCPCSDVFMAVKKAEGAFMVAVFDSWDVRRIPSAHSNEVAAERRIAG